MKCSIIEFINKKYSFMRSIPFNLLLLAVLSVSLVSCRKDKVAPDISITSPADHSEHVEGTTLAIAAQFSDEKELKSYTVFIGDEAGEHSHNFHFEDEGDISGTSYDYSAAVDVPSNIDEVYYLHFEVSDAKGNSSAKKIMLHFHE